MMKNESCKRLLLVGFWAEVRSLRCELQGIMRFLWADYGLSCPVCPARSDGTPVRAAILFFAFLAAGIVEPMQGVHADIAAMGLPVWSDLSGADEDGQAMTSGRSLGWETSDVATVRRGLAAAARSQALCPLTRDEMVHNIEVLEALTVSAEGLRTVEIHELCALVFLFPGSGHRELMLAY